MPGCYGISLGHNTEYKDAWGKTRTKEYLKSPFEAGQQARRHPNYLNGPVRQYSREEIEAINQNRTAPSRLRSSIDPLELRKAER